MVLLLEVAVALTALVAVPGAVRAYTPHPPIVINGNAEFTPANGVTGGSGTAADPYVISGWEIDGSANSGIEVYNTDAHFVIRDVYIHSALLDGIFLFSVTNGRIENATMTGNEIAVYIQVSSNITVVSSNLSLGDLDKIEIDASSNVTVEGNVMWGSGWDGGIFAYDSDDLVIRNNTIANTGWIGIALSLSSDRVLVEGNTVTNNNVAGLALDTASNVTVLDNTFADNDFNVDLANSNDVVIRNNTIATSTADGLTITGGARITVEENNITGNGYGVGAGGATDLLVRHNAFWSNLPQAGDNPGANAWDDGYPSGGNFWSDYAGVDNCSGPLQDVCPVPDGIGDTPYVIDADSRDRYPLMEPFGTGSPGYTVTIIPPLPGDISTIPWAVNATGAVVGWSTDGSVTRPFLFTDAGGTVELPVTGNRTRGLARDLNAAGVAVGELFSPDPGHAFRWSPGPVSQDLGVLGPGPMSEAWGVNETGAVVGGSDYGGFSPHAFLYTDAGGMIDITPAQGSGRAYDVTDGGVVVGYMSAGGGLRAFRWAGGALEDLGVPGGLAHSFGFAINEAGQVAGCADSATGNTERITRYTDGVGWEILGGAGDTNCAWGMNAFGDVVGNGLPTGTGILRAFLYTDAGGMQDLELRTNRTPLLRLLDATDINDAGQIVGYAWDNTLVQYVGYRLDPTVPPKRMLITTNPPGLTVRVDGVDRAAPYSLWCEPSTVHRVEAPSPQAGPPDVRHTYSGWSDGGTQAHDIVCEPMRTVTADFGTQYWLEMNATGGATVTPASSWQDAGAAVTIECVVQPPTPDTRYLFGGWIGSGPGAYVGMNNPVTITVNGPIVEVCNAYAEHRLTFDTQPSGLEVTIDTAPFTTPSVRWCAEGSLLGIGTVTPQFNGTDRYDFDRWSDGGAQAHTITCSAPGVYIAYFLGPFSGIPTVRVVAPNGGEDWTGGTVHAIVWDMNDDGPTLDYTITLSSDGGVTFPTLLSSGISTVGTGHMFAWAVAPVDTTQARIQVCVTDASQTVCDRSDADFTIDSTAPWIVSSDPPDGAVAVDVNAPFVLTFSEAMNRTATEGAISLAPAIGGVTYSWDPLERVLTIGHAPLAPGTVYTLTIGCGALDRSDPGNALAGCPQSLGFTTAAPPEPPTVTVSAPSGGEVWTGGTLHGIGWTMADPDSGDLTVDIAYTVDGGIAWTPIAAPFLRPQGLQSYAWSTPGIDADPVVVRVCASDGSLAGCGLSGAFALDFTAPVVVSVSPPDGARNVALNEPVVVAFSEPMDSSTFPAPGTLLAPPVAGLVATWSGNNQVLTFTHAGLAPCTTYDATIGPGADGSDPGLAMATAFAWSFDTVCAPTVVLLEPVGGEDWTGGTSHAIRFRVTDETDPQLSAWVNATIDGVPSAVFAGPVSQGENVLTWAAPVRTAAAGISVTVADASGLAATATSSAFALDATPPALLSTDPADGATNASVASVVVLTFTEGMDRASVERSIAFVPATPAASYAWDAGSQVVTIAFDGPLAEFTEYALTVGCTARDDSLPGNVLSGCPGTASGLRFRTEIVTAAPVASAAAVADARVGVAVTFDGSASTGDIATWTWTIRTGAGGLVATLDGFVVQYEFAEEGTYAVTLLVEDGFGRTDEYSFEVVVAASTGPSEGIPWLLIAATAAIVGAILLVAASEPGRVALVTATAGRLYGRKPKDEKDSEIRGAILYYVRVHPGDAYMDVKRNLGLNDGAVTYHLARLEKDGLITSAIRGARKRYYPAGMRVPLENGGELHEIQQRLIRLVATEPGMPVAFLAEQLGVSEQLALYHLRKLAGGDYVGLERRGFRLVAVPGTKKP